jgi:hypothetical protein
VRRAGSTGATDNVSASSEGTFGDKERDPAFDDAAFDDAGVEDAGADEGGADEDGGDELTTDTSVGAAGSGEDCAAAGDDDDDDRAAAIEDDEGAGVEITVGALASVPDAGSLVLSGAGSALRVRPTDDVRFDPPSVSDPGRAGDELGE